jgi:AcrR family transcriptional regulator
MPKVSEEYVEQKRTFILECAEKIFSQKPLYKTTMSDIIKETGFSQGNIYRYYTSIIEIYIEICNRKLRPYNPDAAIDEILAKDLSPRMKLGEMIMEIGHYFKIIFKDCGPKMYYELVAGAQGDWTEWKKQSENMILIKNISRLRELSVAFVVAGMQSGEFQGKKMPIEQMVQFIGTSIDGIAMDYSLAALQGEEEQYNMLSMFDALSKMVTEFL